MIISHKHKFVFTRPMKVGSSSAENMIINSTILGDGDFHSGTSENISDDGFLDIEGSLPAGYFANNKTDSDVFAAKVALTHATPDKLFKLGLLNKKQFDKYTFITIARNPIQRYFSSWIYDGGGSFEGFLTKVKKRQLPSCMAFSTPEQHICLAGQPLKNIKVFPTESLNSCLENFITSYHGRISEVLHLKASEIPDWANADYSKWMPEQAINTLKDLLADEICFYQKMTRLTV